VNFIYDWLGKCASFPNLFLPFLKRFEVLVVAKEKSEYSQYYHLVIAYNEPAHCVPLGHKTELQDEIGGEVLGLDLAAPLAPIDTRLNRSNVSKVVK